SETFKIETLFCVTLNLNLGLKTTSLVTDILIFLVEV
ncbi:MAG: hypothetical protein ACI92X_001572, partial [Dokdonia sp.]